MGTGGEKLRSLHKQVIKVVSSIKKSLLLIKLSHGMERLMNPMGWDGMKIFLIRWDGMGRIK